MKSRTQIWITGIVQGVGFRPFIYNLAKKYELKGYVLNNTSGVNIEVEGEPSTIKEFIHKVKTEPPPQTVIFEIKSQNIDPFGYEGFTMQNRQTPYIFQSNIFYKEIITRSSGLDLVSENFTFSEEYFFWIKLNC